jgi:glycosyltransferase involved in cell wall biosynthesis
LPRDSVVIVFGANNWDAFPQPRQHIAMALSRHGWAVTYTMGPHFIWDVLGPRWRNAHWRTLAGSADGVTLNWPGRLQTRWPRFARWDAAVQDRFVAALKRHSGWREATHRIAYLFRPEFASALDRLGPCRVVYHADDSFSKMPGWSERFAAAEAALIDRADLVVAASEGMRRSLSGNGAARARLLPNGADIALFAAGSSLPCPPEIAAIPRPRLGYFGWLNPKVDYRLIRNVACARPDWHWVLVGPVNAEAIAHDPDSAAAWHALHGLPNVHALGARPYRDLPRYQAQMDVNTMCYRSDPGGWWEDVSPLKLYEYLAVGRPVVSVPLEVLAPLAHVVAVASGAAEWKRAIAAALTGPLDPEPGREIARRNDWSAAGDKLDAWLRELG